MGVTKYAAFQKIDGRHPYQNATPKGYVNYDARIRHGGKVAYFNFELAKEMGLIPKSHPNQFNPELKKQLLDTFSLQIINEYDILNKIKFPKKDIKPHPYMATRYLQLQHPNKQGKTSGDGRGIWNGVFTANGTTWDITSSGTGATKLSPASAIEGKFFKTGHKTVCYGCGYNDIESGLSTAVMSEIFHKNCIETERTLVIIEFEDKTAINVRVGKNLLRPSHVFSFLKQNDYKNLKAAVDYHIEREISNGRFPKRLNQNERYRALGKQIALNFSKATAKFESDYVFVWLDWDGDNILMDGGIIDYGSVRQFGLFHKEYRYDDYDRYSTNILEQKLKAKYIIQSFAQIIDYLITGKKKNIKNFSSHSLLKLFDKNFKSHLCYNLLEKIGFNQKQSQYLMNHKLKEVISFQKDYRYFESIQSHLGVYEVDDGISSNAVYCMRDVLRELPKQLVESPHFLSASEFNALACSQYAKPKDMKLTQNRRSRIRLLQKRYLKLLQLVGKKFKLDQRKLLTEIMMRSSIVNRYDRVTGDGVLGIVDYLLRKKNKVPPVKLYEELTQFFEYNDLTPEKESPVANTKINNELREIIKDTAEGF